MKTRLRFGLCSLVLCFILVRAAAGGAFGSPIGLQLQSVNGPVHKDMAGTLEEVHNWGFTEVELAGAMRVAQTLGIKSYFIEDESAAPETGIPESLRFLKAQSW